MKTKTSSNQGGTGTIQEKCNALHVAPPGSGKLFAEPGDFEIRKANESHQKARDCFNGFLEHAREAGHWLCEARAKVKNSGADFNDWLNGKRESKEFPVSRRTAYGYMAIWENRDRIEAQLQDNPDLSLRDALESLVRTSRKGGNNSLKELADKAKKLMQEMLENALKDWNEKERAWLADRIADGDLQLDCEEIITEAFDKLRRHIRSEMDRV